MKVMRRMVRKGKQPVKVWPTWEQTAKTTYFWLVYNYQVRKKL